MNKFLASVIAVAATIAIVTPAQAAVLTPNFNVDITLNTACKMNSAPTAVVFTYTAFGAAASSTGGGFGVQCTNNLTYALTLDGAVAGVGSYTDAATLLDYTLTLSATSATGSGVAQPYTITGAMAAGQAGSCAASAASCTNAGSANKVRTLTVTY